MRLQLSMLLLPRTARENFWAAKLTSLVDFEQLKIPNGDGAPGARLAPIALNAATVRSSASSQVAGRSSPPFVSRTRGWVRRTYDFGKVFRASARALRGRWAGSSPAERPVPGV